MRLKPYHWLLLILIFALILRLVFFTGSGSSDELDYYRYANQVAQGTFKLEPSHFIFRIGLIYPVALLFSLFGVNELAANILTLISSLAGIVLIYHLGKYLFNEKIGLSAAFLLSFYPLDVVYATRLLPDLPSALFMGLSAFLFLYGEKSAKSQSFYYALSGIFLGVAYLIKEVSLLMVLFFGAYAAYKRKFKANYLLIGAGLAIALIMQVAFSYYYSGDLFYQYKINEEQEIRYMKIFYTNYFTTTGLLSRLFLSLPYFMLTDVHYGLFFAFAGIATLYFLFNKRKEAYVPIIWMLVLLLYFNFGTISLKEYIPYPFAIKHLSIITFPAILLIAYFLNEKPMKRIAPFLVLFLLVSSVGYTYNSALRHEIKNIKLAYGYLTKIPDKTVYSDERTAKVLDYLSGFRKSNQIKSFNEYDYYNYEKADRNLRILNLKNVNNAYIIVNFDMVSKLPLIYTDMKFPEEIYNPPKNWKLEKEFGSGNKRIAIYSA